MTPLRSLTHSRVEVRLKHPRVALARARVFGPRRVVDFGDDVFVEGVFEATEVAVDLDGVDGRGARERVEVASLGGNG